MTRDDRGIRSEQFVRLALAAVIAAALVAAYLRDDEPALEPPF